MPTSEIFFCYCHRQCLFGNFLKHHQHCPLGLTYITPSELFIHLHVVVVKMEMSKIRMCKPKPLTYFCHKSCQ